MALTVEKLGVKIGHKVILHDLSVSFAAGKRTAVVGPNGAGKSTLLRMAAGLSGNYSGTIRLDGTDIRKISRRAMAQKLAILPQGATVPADTTVQQLVDYGRFPYRSWFHPGNVKKDREAVEWAMAVTKVEQFANRQLQTLSGGERQRAFLAMALAQQPQYLLLDEPTTYLDIAHQLEVMEIVTHIKEQYGMTVIMVLHDINHALQYADELAVLTNHKVIAQGTPRDILTVDMLAKVFHVKADIFTNSQGAAVLSPVELVR